MDFKTFDQLLQERQNKTVKTLILKAKEYAGNDERLNSFKIIARAEGKPVMQVIWDEYMKHWYSVRELVHHPETITTAMIDEKIGDAINYHHLLEAAMVEELIH